MRNLQAISLTSPPICREPYPNKILAGRAAAREARVNGHIGRLNAAGTRIPTKITFMQETIGAHTGKNAKEGNQCRQPTLAKLNKGDTGTSTTHYPAISKQDTAHDGPGVINLFFESCNFKNMQ